ncbi:MAG TPA: DUF6600 domain-containing protein [Candidatus Acidoferrum sp.]|jgi:hypothetical protein|nr:DUF6600 domain-containing protein [Candidatus Acidoferrum sp.]
MKCGLLLKWALGLVVCGLSLTGGCLEKPSNPPPVQTMAATEAGPEAVAQPAIYETEAPSQTQPTPALEVVTASAEVTPATGVVTAPAQPVAAEKTVPPNLRLSGPALEVVKLANSGMDEAVMLSYVTNSTSTFNLGANEIIYLNDIGVPGSVISAMLQHDQALVLTAANASAAPGPPGPAGPLPGYPPPAEVAPQQEQAAAVYPPLTPPASEVSYGDFYGDLAPYGTWVDIEGYGRCWQPTVVVVNPGWQPYFDCGSWAYTDCGWYWRSDYSWGWAPFHYGRWFRHNGLGWCWAPDTVWGPSWVCWRHSDAFCGWAPLPPGCFFTAGLGFTFHGRSVRDFDDFGLGPRDYRFVAWHDFHDRRLRGHDLPQRDVTQVFNRTVVVNKIVMNNKTVINQGIAPERVANVTQREVRQVALLDRTTTRPIVARADRTDISQRTLAVYRPERAQPGQNAATPGDRSGVPVRQGQVQPTVPAPLAPAATPAARVAGEPAIAPLLPQRPGPVARQPAPAPTTLAPAQTPYARPTWTQPEVQPPSRPNVSRATPWLENHSATPAPAPAARQYTAPSYVPQRSYTPPAAPVAPRWVPMESWSAPARPAVAEVPRYTPPPVQSRPAMPEAPRYTPPAPSAPQSSGAQTRSAPSAPPASSDRGSSSGNSGRR